MIGKFCVFVEKNLMMLTVVVALISVIGALLTNSCETTTIAYMNALMNNITMLA